MNIEELFDNEKWTGYGIVVTDDANLAIDYLKTEVMEYVAGLQKELAEEARLNGMGAEREAKLLARVAELELRLGCCRDASTGKDLLIAELEKRIAELEAQVQRLKDSCDFWCGLAKAHGGDA